MGSSNLENERKRLDVRKSRVPYSFSLVFVHLASSSLGPGGSVQRLLATYPEPENVRGGSITKKPEPRIPELPSCPDQESF